jgi:hypothetical protein
MERSSVDIVAARFSPLDFSNIPGFPNHVPGIRVWEDYLPRFREDDNDNLTHHLVEFHYCMHQLSIFHEDVLMKMFMLSLERDAHQWYRSFPVACIASLKYFHMMFHSHYKRRYPIDLPLGSCCNESFKSVSEDIEDSSCDNEEEGKITDDEFEQDFEREAYYNSENEEDGMANSNEEVSLEGDYTEVSENLQEDTMLLFP